MKENASHCTLFLFLLHIERITGMFTIGLFSTYLPYIIIAIFYGAYVGVHSIMKAELQAGTDESIIAAKRITKENTDFRETQKNTFYYDYYAEQADEPKRKNPVVSIAETLYVNCELAVPRSRYCTTLFCRPPPRG